MKNARIFMSLAVGSKACFGIALASTAAVIFEAREVFSLLSTCRHDVSVLGPPNIIIMLTYFCNADEEQTFA